MRTLGVDLSSQPKATAACRITWSAGAADVDVLELGVDDQRLARLIDTSDKVGLDVPLGWPDVFVDAIARHRRGEPWPAGADNRALRFRRTDLVVWARTGRPPLSVSSDRIALPAFRAARLLSPYRLDRSGSEKFVEVYPRAARDCFALSRTRSVDELLVLAPFLAPSSATVSLCAESDDCFDALIAALVARAAVLGQCEPIPAGERAAATREGWIALPLPGSLSRLSREPARRTGVSASST
jgi:hypothetical protein